MPAPDGSPAPVTGAGAGHEVYGLLRVAGIEVALPLSALREVVACPPELVPLPVRADGLLGAIELRRLVVPVVDLRVALRRTAPAAAAPVVVLVSADDHVIGVLADEVMGITKVAVQDLLSIRAVLPAGGSLLLSHTFRDTGTGRVVSVLDPAALLSLPGVPVVHDVPEPAQTAGAALADRRSAGTVRRLTLVQCGDYLLGVDVEHIHTTLPPSPALPSVLVGGVCTGVTDYLDREVPVVDPLALLGLGALEPEQVGPRVVLDLGAGYVVLTVTALLDLYEAPGRDVLALPAFTVSRGDLFDGLLDIAGRGPCLVVDGNALRGDPGLSTLAGLNTMVDGSEQQEPQVGQDGEQTTEVGSLLVPQYLRFRVGRDVVTALEQVGEILPMPLTLTRTPGGPELLGLLLHRSAAVPVLCLQTLLNPYGAAPAPVTSLLLVTVQGRPVAFGVQSLRAIEPLTWQDASPARSDRTVLSPADMLAASPLVLVGEDTHLLPALDLQALAALVLGLETADEAPGRHARDPGDAWDAAAEELAALR